MTQLSKVFSLVFSLPVLNVTSYECVPQTDPAELQRAYRRLMLQFHPDKHGSKERAQDVTRAYQELQDLGLRHGS